MRDREGEECIEDDMGDPLQEMRKGIVSRKEASS